MISHRDKLFKKKKNTSLTNILNNRIPSFVTALLEKLRKQNGNIIMNSLKIT